MSTHNFTLIFTFADTSLEPHLDALATARCDDAAFAGPASDGTFAAEFDRDADTIAQAISSALQDVQQALPHVQVLRVEPDDLVTAAAIAARTGRSDESIRLLASGQRGPGGFPPPLGRVNEKTVVYSWAAVADWFTRALAEVPPQSEHAAFIAAVNHALQLASITPDLHDHPDELEVVASLVPDELEVA